MFGGHFWSINNFPFLRMETLLHFHWTMIEWVDQGQNIGKGTIFICSWKLFLLNRVIKRTTSMSTATTAVIVSDFILSDIDCDYHLEMHDAISLHDSLCDPNQINTDLFSHLSKCERKNEVLRFNQSVNFHSRQSKS